MSYLQDKKTKKNKLIYAGFAAVIFLVLFYFRTPVLNGFSYLASGIFRPVFLVGNGIGDRLGSIGAYFSSKSTLTSENDRLKSELAQNLAQMSNYSSLIDDNDRLREILGRKSEKMPVVLAAILTKPNQNFYDTLVVDAGTAEGLKKGQIVFALGDVPIGRVGDVYGATSKVVLFSSAGEKTEVVISGKNTFVQISGRGGGNFELVLPRDFVLDNGTNVVLPGIVPHVVGTVQTIISDPRDAFQKALLVSPINIEEIKFVQIEL